MLECIASSHTAFWVLTGLLIISEALGETKVVRANGVLSIIIDLLEGIFRIIRKVFYGR